MTDGSAGSGTGGGASGAQGTAGGATSGVAGSAASGGAGQAIGGVSAAQGWAEAREALRARGIESRALPVTRLRDLRAWLQEAALSGQLSDRVLQEFHFSLEEADLPALPTGRPVQSFIVVASRSPFAGAVFRYDSRRHEYVTPPTYGPAEPGADALSYLSAAFGSFAFTRIRLPEKTTAVFSGLARWGRNNIAYVPGWGSYVGLACLASDMPVDETEGGVESWGPALLPRCEACIACARACPTGAIDGDRVLLHTERCITFMNENDEPFPEWVPRSAHTCPVGCVACQRACPENSGCEQRGPVSEFSEEETRMLLAGVQEDELNDGLRERLVTCGLFDYLPQLPRNLAVLFG